jgi:hypothetical protein
VRQRGPYQAERGLEHQRKDLPKLLLREFLNRRDVLDAGVVHHDVHVGGECPRVERGVREVDGNRNGAERPGHLFGPVAVQIGHGNQRSRGGELRRARRADSARPARDEHPPAAQVN